MCIGTGTSQPCVLQYIVCCNSLVFFTSVSADRNGMAASKSSKELPIFPGKHILKHVFPTCHVKVSKFYQSCMPPIASSSSSSSSFTSSSSTPPSTASQISVGTAGLQPRAPDFSGHCRAPTATARSQWVQPDTASARSQWALPLSIEWGGAIPAS